MIRVDSLARGRDTAFSRLDFRAKLAVFAAVSVAAVAWDDPRLGVLLTLATAAGCLGAGVKPAYLWLVARVMAPFLLLLLLTHGFFNVQPVLRLTGHARVTPLLSIPASWPGVGGLVFSLEGGLYGVNVCAKALTLLLLVPLCVLTTDPNNIVTALVRLRVPYRFAFAFASTLRFFPLLMDEIGLVIDAQRLRGFAVEEMGVLERVRTYAKVAVPVILGAMFRAQQIEVVLQSRGFSGQSGRTYLRDSVLGRAGTAVIVGSAVFATLVVGLRVGAHVGAFTTALLP